MTKESRTIRNPLVLLSLLLVASAKGQGPANSTVLPAQLGSGAWAVSASVDGKEGLFLVYLQADKSKVSKKWLGRNQGELRLGHKDLGSVVATDDFRLGTEIRGKPVVGILGLKSLRRFALGFDPAASTLTLWEKPSSEEIVEWVGAGAESASLGTLKGEGAFLKAKLRSVPIVLRLATPGSTARLRKGLSTQEDLRLTNIPSVNLADGSKQTVEVYGTSGLSVESGGLAWVRYSVGPTDDFGGADGELPADAPFSGRIVVDLARGGAIGRPKSVDAALAGELSALLNIDVVIDNDALRIDKVGSDERLAPLRDYAGHEVLLLDSRLPKELLGDLRGPGRTATFKALEEARRKGFSVLVQTVPGTNRAIRFNYPPADDHGSTF